MNFNANLSNINSISGNFDAKNYRFAIVVSKFNEFITNALLGGCLETLAKANADNKNISVVNCPGAFEIPYLVNQLAKTKNYDAIITIGCVIRGATPHFDYVAGQVASGIASLNLQHDIPIIFGVLTTDTIDQAIERCGTKAGNKGIDAAMAAIEMASLSATINRSKK